MNTSRPLIDMETLERVAPIIRTAAHPLRLRVVDYLAREAEPRTVASITEACETRQAVVSQQLRILKDQGIVAARRSGSNVYYTLVNRSVLHLLECIRSHGGSCAL